MTRQRDLSRLKDLAQLVLDHRLARLRSATERLDQSRAQMSALNRAPTAPDLDPVVSARVGLGYERWADVRRAELNIVIARQSAEWLDAREDARIAFGRAQALRSLTDRAGPGQS